MRRLLWIAAALITACAIQEAIVTEEKVAPPPPRPTLNHALHLAEGIECADCHALDDKGRPAPPNIEFCAECHDDIENDAENVQKYFAEIKNAEGVYVFPRLPYIEDLKVNHGAHAAAEIACASCHGEPSEKAFDRAPLYEFKRACLDCHEQKQAPVSCEACHDVYRKDVKPPDHDAAFQRTHGAQAPRGWQDGQGASCAFCHEVPNTCNTCHSESQPNSHRTAAFRINHGKGDTDALEGRWRDVSCALCHQKDSCVQCHQTTKPRSHTATFERRLHGIQAGIERESCRVCHKQDYCNTCHEQARPVSHRGSFGSGRQTHCVSCHVPLNANSCFTCHKDTLGHRTATPLPAGVVHAMASSPGDCNDCHPILPHLDNGGNCRSCHR